MNYGKEFEKYAMSDHGLSSLNMHYAKKQLENSLTPSEMNRLTDPDGANRFTEDSLRAALVLGLPSTKAKFDKYVEKHGTPNEAILNNDILDYDFFVDVCNRLKLKINKLHYDKCKQLFHNYSHL